MLLRRLFYGKVGMLTRQRRDCLLRMPHAAAAAAEHEVSDGLSQVVSVAQELVGITAAETDQIAVHVGVSQRGKTLLCMCLPSRVVGQNATLCIGCPLAHCILLHPAPSHMCLTVSQMNLLQILCI